MSVIRLAGHRPQVSGLQFIDEVAAPPSVGDPCLVRIGLKVYLQDSNGVLWPLIPGADSAGVVTVTAAMSPYAVQPSDRYLLVDTSGGPVQVNMPASPIGVNPIRVVDAKRSFATNNLTLNGGTHNINGAATLVVAIQDACPLVIFGGTTWETNPSAVAVPFNPHAPGPLGDTTPGTGAFTTITVPSLAAGGTNPLSLSAGPTTGYGVAVATLTSTVAQTTAGSCLLEMADANHGGSTVSNAFYGASSGGQSDALCDGYVMTASGSIGDGDVCVWSAKNTVTKSGASAHLTPIAGVAVGAATGGKVRVATRGQVYTNCEAGISGAGTQVGTSGSTAGRCDSLGVTTVASLLGRTLEASGATVSGKILIQLALG